jgi:hypothetical protein
MNITSQKQTVEIYHSGIYENKELLEKCKNLNAENFAWISDNEGNKIELWGPINKAFL